MKNLLEQLSKENRKKVEEQAGVLTLDAMKETIYSSKLPIGFATSVYFICLPDECFNIIKWYELFE